MHINRKATVETSKRLNKRTPRCGRGYIPDLTRWRRCVGSQQIFLLSGVFRLGTSACRSPAVMDSCTSGQTTPLGPGWVLACYIISAAVLAGFGIGALLMSIRHTSQAAQNTTVSVHTSSPAATAPYRAHIRLRVVCNRLSSRRDGRSRYGVWPGRSMAAQWAHGEPTMSSSLLRRCTGVAEMPSAAPQTGQCSSPRATQASAAGCRFSRTPWPQDCPSSSSPSGVRSSSATTQT